jgi:hypothetical protein
MFKCDDFTVYKLTSGEEVTEWTGKKHILKSF